MSNSLLPLGLYSPRNSPGQNTGVGSLFLLQGIFPNQGSNPGPPPCRWILYQLSHKGRPRTLNTRVGHLSLLQGIFPTQESNQGLLHCTRIPYQLSHQGTPGSSYLTQFYLFSFLRRSMLIGFWLCCWVFFATHGLFPVAAMDLGRVGGVYSLVAEHRLSGKCASVVGAPGSKPTECRVSRLSCL